MKYIALAMLLVIVQTSPPIPGKTPNNRTETSDNSQKQAQYNKTNPDQTPAPLQVKASLKHDDQTSNKGDDNKVQSVSISKLPPVSVIRDWADCVSLVFNILLVIVGALTLGAIWYQAREMKRATEVMER